MQDFRNLDLWKKAHALVLATHKATQAFGKEEVFGLTLQLRRGTIGMASRIAEGCGGDTDADFAADLKRVATMTSEVEYHLLLARDLSYLTQEAQESLTARLVEVRKMTFGLLRSL